MGDAEDNNKMFEKLTRRIEEFYLILLKMLELYNDCKKHYSNSMRNSFDKSKYVDRSELMKLHQNIKNEVNLQVCTTAFDAQITSDFDHIFNRMYNL